MSNLVDHARRELEILGEEEDTIQGYCTVIQAFSDMGHSGGSASVMIPHLCTLLQYGNLMPLTNNPAEWCLISSDMAGRDEPLWQSERNCAAFSDDGGESYYFVTTPGGSEVTFDSEKYTPTYEDPEDREIVLVSDQDVYEYQARPEDFGIIDEDKTVEEILRGF